VFEAVAVEATGEAIEEAMEVRMEIGSSVVEVMEVLEAEVLKALTKAGAEAEEDMEEAREAEEDLGDRAWEVRETGWATEGATPLP
jgi:hypothetical protein